MPNSPANLRTWWKSPSATATSGGITELFSEHSCTCGRLAPRVDGPFSGADCCLPCCRPPLRGSRNMAGHRWPALALGARRIVF